MARRSQTILTSPPMSKTKKRSKPPWPRPHWLGCVGAGERAARRSASWIPAMAMAAGIVLGVLLAASFGIGTDMRSDGGTLIAQGELAHMLNTALTSDQQDALSNRARVGASFWSKNGVFCRSFTTQRRAASALAGLACRERGAWRIAALAAIESGESAGTRQVSARFARLRARGDGKSDRRRAAQGRSGASGAQPRLAAAVIRLRPSLHGCSKN